MPGFGWKRERRMKEGGVFWKNGEFGGNGDGGGDGSHGRWRELLGNMHVGEYSDELVKWSGKLYGRH